MFKWIGGMPIEVGCKSKCIVGKSKSGMVIFKRIRSSIEAVGMSKTVGYFRASMVMFKW